MNRDFKQMAPLERQADMLASKGRFGDTMLVHMNPTEVDVLRQMTPGGQLTINPDTGQPEAFLPLLLGLAGGFLGGAGALGGLGALTAGAIGTGLGTTIETGSLKEGLKAGLISGLIGGVAGRLLEGAGSVATKGVEESVKAGGGEALAQTTSQAFRPGDLFRSNTVGNVGAVVPDVTGQVVSEAASQTVAEATKPSLLKQLTQGGIPQVGTEGAKGFAAQVGTLNPTQNILTGGTAGLTGQAMADQYNLMNMPIGPGLDEDAEDFYVPVTADDRGVQFPGVRQGTAEFDYFANPFSFTQNPITPPPSFKEGGMIKGLFRGGRTRDERDADAAAQEAATVNRQNTTPTFRMPSYITGQPAQQNTENMIEETFVEQIYTPRSEMMPQTSMSNIRGASNVDFTDYNRRLLGDPTREVTRMRQMTEEEIAARDAAAAEAAEAEAAAAETSTTPASTATSGLPPEVAALIPAGSDFSELPPDVQAQIVAGIRESIGRGGEMGAYSGAAFDPTLPASDFSVPATDGSMDAMMGGDVGFNPVPPVQTAPAPVMSTPAPVMSTPAVSPVTPIPSPLSAGFDPLANVDFSGMGRGGLDFGGMGGMGGMSIGM